MKTLTTQISIQILIFVMLLSTTAWAFEYKQYGSEAMATIQRYGATVYNYKLQNGNVRRIRILSYISCPQSDCLIVQGKFDDNIEIIDLSDEEQAIVYAPASTESDPTSPSYVRSVTSTSDIKLMPLTGSDLVAGVDAGLKAMANFILITNSHDLKNLQKTYEAIDKIHQEIDVKLSEVHQVAVDLQKHIIEIRDQVESHPLGNVSTTSLETHLGNFTVWHDQSGLDLSNVQWLSHEPEFTNRADDIRSKLLKNNPQDLDQVGQSFYSISKTALLQADQSYYLNFKDESQFLLDIAETAANFLVGLDPLSGLARSIYETVTGTNLITGEKLTIGQHILAGLGILTSGYSLKATQAVEVLARMGRKIAPSMAEGFKGLRTFLKATGQDFKLIGEGSLVRKINLRSESTPHWGFSPRHLNKHFFGEHPTALKVIDPAGNPDQWMQNMADLVQRPVQKIHPNGMQDIYHVYQKADGHGFYQLGVRLAPKTDKSFDLVTILTDQTKGPL